WTSASPCVRWPTGSSSTVPESRRADPGTGGLVPLGQEGHFLASLRSGGVTCCTRAAFRTYTSQCVRGGRGNGGPVKQHPRPPGGWARRVLQHGTRRGVPLMVLALLALLGPPAHAVETMCMPSEESACIAGTLRT